MPVFLFFLWGSSEQIGVMIGCRRAGEASSFSVDARVHFDSAKDLGVGDEE